MSVDPVRLRDALDDCDAVISTLGVGSARGPTRLYSSAISAVLRVAPGPDRRGRCGAGRRHRGPWRA